MILKTHLLKCCARAQFLCHGEFNHWFEWKQARNTSGDRRSLIRKTSIIEEVCKTIRRIPLWDKEKQFLRIESVFLNSDWITALCGSDFSMTSIAKPYFQWHVEKSVENLPGVLSRDWRLHPGLAAKDGSFFIEKQEFCFVTIVFVAWGFINQLSRIIETNHCDFMRCQQLNVPLWEAKRTTDKNLSKGMCFLDLRSVSNLVSTQALHKCCLMACNLIPFHCIIQTGLNGK